MVYVTTVRHLITSSSFVTFSVALAKLAEGDPAFLGDLHRRWFGADLDKAGAHELVRDSGRDLHCAGLRRRATQPEDVFEFEWCGCLLHVFVPALSGQKRHRPQLCLKRICRRIPGMNFVLPFPTPRVEGVVHDHAMGEHLVVVRKQPGQPQ
jgi:hypothetical protein